MKPALIAIGASAGGITALQTILKSIRPGYPIPIVVVIHLPADSPSLLPEIFTQAGPLPTREPEDKESPEGGVLYVAPPAYHLMLEQERTFCLSVDEPVHFSIPSIDVLFSSVAEAYGPEAVGVALTGASSDGAEGLRRIADAGGVALVQKPETASMPTLPDAASQIVPSARVITLEEIGAFLASFDSR